MISFIVTVLSPLQSPQHAAPSPCDPATSRNGGVKSVSRSTVFSAGTASAPNEPPSWQPNNDDKEEPTLMVCEAAPVSATYNVCPGEPVKELRVVRAVEGERRR